MNTNDKTNHDNAPAEPSEAGSVQRLARRTGAAPVPEVEREAGAEPEYCEVCSRAKAENEYEIPVCTCLGIQTYAMSCYPGEHRLVRSHPNNEGEAWYRREDVEALLRRMGLGEQRPDSEPRHSPSGGFCNGNDTTNED